MILVFGAAALAGALISLPLFKLGRGVNPAGLERVERFACMSVFPVLLIAAFWVVSQMYPAGYLRVLGIVAALPILITLLVVLRRGGAHLRSLPQIAAGVTLLAVGGSEAVLSAAAAGAPPAKFPALMAQLGGARALHALAASLGDPDAEIRHTAAAELAKLGAVATPTFTAALGDRDVRIRRIAAQAVSKSPGAAHTALLSNLLRDPDRNIRESAATGLMRLADPATIPALIAACAAEPEAQVRTHFMYPLERMGAVVVPTLSRLSKDDDPSVRVAISQVLGRFASGPSTLLLLELVREDDDPRVRQTAAEEAGKSATSARESEVRRLAGLQNGTEFQDLTRGYVDAQTVLQGLAAAASDPHPRVREAAVKGIGEILDAENDEMNGLKLDLRDPENGLTPVDYTVVVGALSRTAVDPDAGVRGAAAIALNAHPDRRTAPAMVRALGMAPSAPALTALAEALGKVGDRQAIPALKAADSREEPRGPCDICKALFLLGAQDAIRHRVVIERGRE